MSVTLVNRITKTSDVYIQDQTSPSVIVKFNRVTNTTATDGAVAIGDRSVTVASATGISAGSYLIIYNGDSNRYFLCHVVSIVSTTATIDTPFDFAFPSGSTVDVAITNMNENGSSMPLVFGIRGSGMTSAVPSSVDITRIILTCITESAADLSLFGDLTELTNGLVMRHRKLSSYNHIFNVKSNRELAGIMFDFDILSASNPAQGVDGFKGRLTFAGQEKVGVVKRLRPGEDLELIIADDLSGLTTFEVIAEGHIVE